MTIASVLPVAKAPRWIAALGLFLATAMPALAQCPLSFPSVVGCYARDTSPTFVAVGDFNADGRPDLALASFSSAGGTVSILLGNGGANVTFQAPVNYAVGANPTSVAVGDFNADGRSDLAVANSPNAVGFSNNVSILLANANGTFLPAVNYAAGDRPRSIAVGDFNADGQPDLAVVNAFSSNVSILLGNANGTFLPAVNYAAGPNPRSVAVGDFNADGQPDLAVANFGSDNVSILLGNGNGTFQARVNYAVGSPGSPVSVAVGDFNADGRPDLAVANNSSDNISILLGNANGSFQTRVNYAAGDRPASVAVGDFNADCRLDLAVANGGGGNVSILLGNANGTFQAAVNYTVDVCMLGESPNSVAVGDFNADGRPDLAVTSLNGSNVSILPNTCLPTLAILQQPVSKLVAAGQSAVIAITAIGLGNTLTYQWHKNGTPVANGGNISGATTPTLSFTPTLVGDTASYDVVVSATACGETRMTTSAAAILSVSDLCAGLAPSITQQPASQAVMSGNAAVFTIAATSPAGGGTLAYQWRLNGVNLSNGGTVSGVFTPTLTIAAATFADNAATFDCIVSNACGSTRSDPAGLGVPPDCPADFNADGGVDGSDVDAFFDRWVTGC